VDHAAYLAILRRLGVEPDASPIAGPSDPLAWRVAAFRRQLGEWLAAGRLGVPLLTMPGVALAESACVGCGEPLSDGRSWRCPDCVEAVRIALGLPR